MFAALSAAGAGADKRKAPHRAAPDHKVSDHKAQARKALEGRLARIEQDRADRAAQEVAAVAARKAADAQAAALSRDLVAGAAALRRTEAAVQRSDDAQRGTETALARADAALAQHASAFSALLPLALRMSRYPAETMLAVPGPPDRVLEGLLVARGLAAQLNREEAGLLEARDSASRLRAMLRTGAETLAEARLSQREAAATLEQQLVVAKSQANRAHNAAQAASDRAASSAARATTLRGAIAALDVEKPNIPEPPQDASAGGAPAAGAPAAETRSTPRAGWIVPVAGRITRNWGEAAEDGPATGATYATAPGAFVASPCAGRVAFAAPFRSYGKLLIVECRGGIDAVLAGLDRLDAAVGKAVKAGEPVGRMAESHGSLYVELRRGGAPVDPAPFLNTKG